MHYQNVLQEQREDLEMICLSKNGSDEYINLFAEGANINPTSGGTTGFTDFADLTFGTATVTARGCLIYNDTASGDPSVATIDFGGDKTSTAGDFTIVFPSAAASTAIIRIA